MLRLLLLLGMLPAAWAVEPALMPLPAKVSPGTGALAIDRSFTVATADLSDPRLDAAMLRLTARLARQTGVPIPGQKTYHTADAMLRIECRGRGGAYPTVGDDESYTLHVTPQGAVLRAAEVAGALHGIETFAQLAVPAAGGFAAPAIDIEDRPRFGWRGLMLDCSRHFMPVELIERNLDAMAGVKLNVFHWHLSDDQGFRAESESFPKLQETGSDGLYYTRSDIRRILAYARDRGIRVVPEFDVPGHTTSWLVGYPELASAPGPYTIGRTWGVYENALDPTKEETYEFLDKLIGDMAALFPDPYFHIGGDEVVAKQWNANPQIQAFARAHNLNDAHALQAYFNQRVSAILKKHGKIMIGWDEILHPDLPQGTVVQSWRGQKSLAEAAAKGFRGILSWGYYLDHLSPARYHYGIDPLAGGAAQLTPEQAQRILGGEACMWAEYVSAETVDSRIWPRAAAIAERLWSPRETTDVESMYARLASISRWLEWSGVQHRANYGPMLERLAGNR
ncbi:MAG TPA: family 20 glycosylhydrolase, partial [Bryobacteraceae bacterium]